jgi:hypothetical protein
VLSAERFQHLHASKDELRPLKMRGPRVSKNTILHSPLAGSQRFTSLSLRSSSNKVNIIIRSP